MATQTSSLVKSDRQQCYSDRLCSPRLTRRDFLKLAALGMVVGAAKCVPLPTIPATTVVPVILPLRQPAPLGALSDATVAAVESEMLGVMGQYNIPGLALAVMKEGCLALTRHYGVAKRGTDRLITPQSIFAWGGIAETVVATGIMRLRSQGKVNLDAPVTQYLPYFKLDDKRYTDITLRHLLSCTSGLPECVGEDLECRVQAGSDDTLEQQVRRLATRRLACAPGEKFALNQVGFEVLGDVIAKVSGQAFEDYMREQVFVPLGLRHTTFSLCEVDPQLMVAPHVLRTGDTTEPILADSRAHAPSSGLFSTLEDMARYALMHLKHGSLNGVQILRAGAYDEMWKDQATTPWAHIPAGKSEHRSRCLGWYSYLDRGGNRVVFSIGEHYAGFFTYLELVPEKGAAVVFAVNRYGDLMDYYGDLEPSVSRVMDLVLGNPSQPAPSNTLPARQQAKLPGAKVS